MKKKKKSNPVFLKPMNSFTPSFLVLTVLIVYCMCDVVQAQSNLNEENVDTKWKFIVSGGLSFIPGKTIYGRNEIDLSSESNFNVNLIDYSIGFNLLSHHELGVSIGRKDFVFEKEFVSLIIFERGDTIYATGFEIENLLVTSLFYKYNLSNEFNFGLKLGRLNGRRVGSVSKDLNINYSTYYEIFTNKIFEISKIMFFNLGMSFSIRSKDFMKFDKNSSPQVSIITGLGFKF